MTHHTAQEYVEKLVQVKPTGVSGYSAHAIKDEDHPVLGAAIGRRSVARP